MNRLQTNRLIMLVIASAAVAFVGCNKKPSSDKDQLSYTVGVNYGRTLKGQKVDVNPKVIAQAISDVMGDKTLAMTEEEMRAAIDKANQTIQKASQEEAEGNLKKSQEFLEKNKTAEGVTTSESGLQFKVLTEGNGQTPKETDVVSVHYKGTLIDGTEFDSSYKTNKPAEFEPKMVIKGWQEGLQKMKKGGKYQLVIPPELGYGPVPRPGIPANSALIFEVELLDVKKPTPAKK